MASHNSAFTTLLFVFAFAAVISNIAVGSHNLHGYKKSLPFHKSCIEQYGGIWFGQELWLQEKQLSQMTALGVQFVARSGMEDAVSSGILKGRPYGGVSIAWAPEINHAIKPLVNYRHKRLVCVEMTAIPKPVLFVCLYMPFYDSSKRMECLAETMDTISMLEELIADHPFHKFIIGGDFNTEFRGNSPFDELWKESLSKNNLTCCDNLFSSSNNNNNNHTYIHQSLNHCKWNDHFFISDSLIDASSQHLILDDGDNVSDHLPIMMSLKLCLSPNTQESSTPQNAATLKWEKCSENHKLMYKNNLSQRLNDSPSMLPDCETYHCKSHSCQSNIQAEYDNLIKQIQDADKCLPRFKPGVQKTWWTDELSSIRQKSIDIHRLWLSEGKPRSGPTNTERLKVKAEYKKAIRNAQRSPKQACWNRLHTSLSNKDTSRFWSSWKQIYSKDKSHLHPVVNGVSDKREIASSFSSHFEQISQPNNAEKVDLLNAKFQSMYCDAVTVHECKCQSHNISLQIVLDAAFSMNKGKCCDDEMISAEHFFDAPLTMFDRLHQLFNSMLRHSFVPSQFQSGTIIPIVKDRHGDKGDMNNYRGISIAPIVSKIFEHVLRIIFHESLSTSQYQFGFKRKSSTSHALFCLKEAINYYTQQGSNVYCSFLDASKAFDRLVHAGLFMKLLQRGVPLVFLDVIIYWYSNLNCRVRWGEAYSKWFFIAAGVRQGGILSPIFYCIYVDDLVQILSDSGIGCHIRDVFLSILLYADDMCLSAPSLGGLQKLLSLVGKYCHDWDIMLNPKKSKNMQFGKKANSLPPLLLNGKSLEWVEKWSYLGVTLSSHKQFNSCISNKLKSFYRSDNAILRIEGRSNELVMLQLLESHCISVLTYAIEVIYIADRDIRRKLRVAYNSIFRQIFGYRISESVTDLQHQLGRPTWEELIEARTSKFIFKLSDSVLTSQLLS